MAGDESAPISPKKANLSDVRTLIVGTGPEQKRFTVHTFVLSKSSQFFRAACRKRWNPGKVIELPEAEPDVVEAYLQWLFSGELYVLPPEEAKLSFSQNQADGLDDDVELAIDRAFNTLLDLYQLGTYLLDSRFCNAIIDMFMKYDSKTGSICGVAEVRKAYQVLHPQSTLFRLLLVQHVSMDADDFEDNVNEDSYPAAFRKELLRDMHGRLNSGIKLRNPLKEGRCAYHDHNEDVPKCGGPKPW